jgi:lipopolysaccharide transport system permease protein
VNSRQGAEVSTPAAVTRPAAGAPGTAAREAPARRTTVVIKPSRGWLSLGLNDVWDFRELLFLLAWRDVKVRYKQTALGFGWAIIPPLLNMVAFSLIFGGLAKVPSSGLPYPVFTYAALVPWFYFSQAAARGAGSLVGSSALVSKVYFPRMIIPLAAVLTPVVDFLLALVVLFALMGWYGIAPTWGALALPGFFLLAFATALAVALVLSAVNVRYRDVTLGIAFLLQFWMYISPVIYPASLVPHSVRLVYSLNPMTGVIDGFRWGLLGLARPDLAALAVSCGAVVVLLFAGLVYFRRTERTFVDIL